MRCRFDCAALLAKARADYFALLYSARGSLPLYEAHYMVASAVAGLTFNWAVLVAYAAKTGTVSVPLLILYTGLIFWTVGYDTIYACQDIEDDMKIGVKSTARRFGKRVKLGISLSYLVSVVLLSFAVSKTFKISQEELNKTTSYSIDVPLIVLFLSLIHI